MFHEKHYKRRVKQELQQNNNNNDDESCCVPGTPVKGTWLTLPQVSEFSISAEELNKGIDAELVLANFSPAMEPEREKILLALESCASQRFLCPDSRTDGNPEQVSEFSISAELNKGIDAELVLANFSPAPEPEREKILLAPESCASQRFICPDSGTDGNPEQVANFDLPPNWNEANNVKNLQNGTNSSESCVLLPVQQKEEDGVTGMEVENSKRGLKRGPKQKPKRKKIRPKVLVEGKPMKTPQPKTPKPKKTPQPKTPKPETPEPANETTRKRKYVRKNAKENFVSGDVVDESVNKKRKRAKLNRKSDSDAIIELPPTPPPKTCRQALNFDLESRDDKDVKIAIPECRFRLDECHFTKAITECEILVDECVDGGKQSENNKTRSKRSKRRRRLNTLFMLNLPVVKAQYPRRRIRRRATRRCNIASLTAIPICSQLPKLPSKQAAPIDNAIPICSQLPKLSSRQAVFSDKEETEIIYEPEANKNMLWTNNIDRNVAGRTAIDRIIGSQKALKEPGMGLQEALLEHTRFLQEERLAALQLLLEQRLTTLFPGQSYGLMASLLELLQSQKHVIYLEHLWEQIIRPSSQQVLQQSLVIQTKPLKPEDLWLSAKSRGSHRIMQVPRNHLSTQKKSPRKPRGSKEGKAQKLRQSTIAAIIRKFKKLTIRDGGCRLKKPPYNKEYGLGMGHGALVPCQVGPSSGQAMVVTNKGKRKQKKLMPEVDLDPKSLRMWHLIMNIDDATTKEQTRDEDMEKWWEKEREFFGGRIRSFTTRMHLILGDRRFKPWKGSVLDSVVGVYLTQNCADTLSSSAFMSLAARFPLKSTSNHTPDDENLRIATGQESIGRNSTSNRVVNYLEGNMYFVNEPEPDRCCELKDRGDPFDSRIQENSLVEIEDTRVMKDVVASQTFDTSSVEILDRLMLSPTGNLKGDVASSSKTSSPGSFIPQLSPTGNLKADVASPRKTYCRESSITSTEIPQQENNTTSPQDLRDKVVDEISFCSKSLEGYATPTRMNIGSQASKLERNDMKVDCGSTASTDFIHPRETSVSPSNGGGSGTGMPQAHDATTTRKNSLDSKSGMKNSQRKKTNPNNKKDNQEQQDWDLLRRMYSTGAERSSDQMDSVDWEAVRCAEQSEIADAIEGRGQHNIIAGRIKDFLNRMIELHGSIDIEWLRNVPPDKVKEYLLDIPGLGLKSVECIRLLSLQHIAFPVDVNVGRIAVRLGWVPLQPLPGDTQFHLLEEYPVMDTIQKYLWPRLSCYDQKTLYELHYQMITFGKVFCKKKKPNCGACPLRGECKHYTSAFASARFALTGPSEKGIVTSEFNNEFQGNPLVVDPTAVIPIEADAISESGCQINNCEPKIEEPQSPGPQCEESPESVMDDDYSIGDIEDIPTIRLQEREFKENVQDYIEKSKIILQDSNALVLLTEEAAFIPPMKLKKYAHLRTEHKVYVLPDDHELLHGFERRDPDDPSPYLLTIWSPGDTPNSIVPSQYRCNSKESKFCNVQMCYSCNSARETNAGIVRGTILIPSRTANRGRFPLNGTYFQVNEVFADHETSYHPINVPRHLIAHLPTQKACFGASAISIFNALELREIQECFWRGFVCVRGFDRRFRCPRPLTKRLHCSPSNMERGSKKPIGDEK